MDTALNDRDNLNKQMHHMCKALLTNNELTIKDLAEYLDCSEIQLSSDYEDSLPPPNAEIYGKISALYIIKCAAEI